MYFYYGLLKFELEDEFLSSRGDSCRVSKFGHFHNLKHQNFSFMIKSTKEVENILSAGETDGLNYEVTKFIHSSYNT